MSSILDALKKVESDGDSPRSESGRTSILLAGRPKQTSLPTKRGPRKWMGFFAGALGLLIVGGWFYGRHLRDPSPGVSAISQMKHGDAAVLKPKRKPAFQSTTPEASQMRAPAQGNEHPEAVVPIPAVPQESFPIGNEMHASGRTQPQIAIPKTIPDPVSDSAVSPPEYASADLPPVTSTRATPALPKTTVPLKPPIDLNIQAIAWSKVPRQRIVVINGAVLHEGGTVAGVTVDRIERDEVWVRSGDQAWRLKFGRN